MLGAVARKVGNTTAEEIVFRSKAFLRRWHEECCYRLGLNGSPQIDLRSEQATVFGGLWIEANEQRSVAGQLRCRYPAYVQQIRNAADAICNRQFTLLGVPIQYRSEIPWRADPLSGREWPASFYARINIFGGNTGNGDVKYVWELNRHQFLITLGKAYRLTGDERYGLAALELIEGWIRDNTYQDGVNWTSGLEVAIRSLSWCGACALFEGAAAFGSEKRRNIVQSLYQHAQFIENHLSFFFSPYNHLVGEATALFVLAHLFSWLKAALRWREKGWTILEQEMPKQFHSDGGTVEQAAGYHHFTLGFYLQAVLFRRSLGLPIPAPVWSLLEKAFEFSMYMMRPDGSLPMIGDADEGKAIDMSQTSIWDFRSLLSIGAVLFQRGDFKKMAGSFPADAAWLLGSQGWNAYDALGEEEPAEKSKAFTQSGYWIMRTGWDDQSHYLNFDCGEIAAGVPAENIPSAAHGHADALSIEVSAFGVPALVDSGFYTYNGDERWHRYFRETAAHNTVVIDGHSQAEYCGRLKWSHAPETKLHHWLTSRPFDYVEGSHNGYTRLPQGVIHRRAVAFLKPDYWFVRDELVGEGEHQIDRYFHFASLKLLFDKESQIIRTTSDNGKNLAVLFAERDCVAVEVRCGGEAPDEGWLATGYGKKASAPVARCATRARVPIALHTLLVPFRDAMPDIKVEPIQITGSRSRVSQGFAIQIGGKKDILLFSSKTGNRTVELCDGWRTDARVTCVRLNENRNVTSCSFVDGSVVTAGKNVLLKTTEPVPFASLSFEKNRRIVEIPEAIDASVLATACELSSS